MAHYYTDRNFFDNKRGVVVVMREFNVTGICVKNKHYMVDTSEKLAKIKSLVDKGYYFTINRARQYGKTTTLYLLSELLTPEYLCIKISFEGLGNESFETTEAFCDALLSLIQNALYILPDEDSRSVFQEYGREWHDKTVVNFKLLSRHITKMCKGRRVVLMVDEVDKISNNQVFLHFLGMLRDKYQVHNANGEDTFHTVILTGVHDIKNIKQKLITQGAYVQKSGEGIYNSPWNIAVDFDVDMSFNAKEISTMLVEYEKDYNTGMDISAISQEIYSYTRGYPFLVSRLCQHIDKKLDKNWTLEGVQEAVKIVLAENNTLFDDIYKNLGNYQDLYNLMYGLIISGVRYTYNIGNPSINFGMMYGLLMNIGGSVAVSNKIFELIISNYFISRNETEHGKKITGVLMEDVVNGGKFDMEGCLRKFAEHYYEMFTEKDISFLERHGRLLFLTYLKPLINGTGFYYIEAQTRSQRRMDIVLDYNKEQFIIELKLWHGENYKEKAYKQLLDYMESKNAKVGYLLTFNFNKNSEKVRGAKWIDCEGKRIFDVVI